jgi:hypothetical protein
MQQQFYVILTQGPFRKELGEMTEWQVYGFVRTECTKSMAPLDAMAATDAVLAELESSGVSTVRLTDPQYGFALIEIRRMSVEVPQT